MVDFKKMKKSDLKDIVVRQLHEVEEIMEQSKEGNNDFYNAIGSIIYESGYLENRHLKNPNDFMHKMLKKDNYLSMAEKLNASIDQINELKKEYDSGNFNQTKQKEKGNHIQKEITHGVERSTVIQNNKSNQNQVPQESNEKFNQNESSRGGKRKGAGRKGFGITKKVSLTLTEDVWKKIEQECKSGKKQSQVLRELIEKGLGN